MTASASGRSPLPIREPRFGADRRLEALAWLGAAVALIALVPFIPWPGTPDPAAPGGPGGATDASGAASPNGGAATADARPSGDAAIPRGAPVVRAGDVTTSAHPRLPLYTASEDGSILYIWEPRKSRVEVLDARAGTRRTVELVDRQAEREASGDDDGGG